MNARTIDERKVGPLTVSVEYDEDGSSSDPRDWTNVGTMVGTSDRYAVGDYQVRNDYDDWHGYGCVENWLITEYDAIRSTITRLYVHGSEAGWHFATPAGLKETGVTLENAADALELEAKVYEQWGNGEVYGYVVEDEAGNVRDSCWGYVGEPEYAMSEGIEAATYDPRYQTWLGLQSACRGEGDER